MSKNQKHQSRVVAPSNPKLKQYALAGFLILMGVFYAHAHHFDFIQDDSFITFRYIKNLIEGHGLVWNVGERVEGYTTFLWTIVLALPAYLGVDIITGSQILGVLFGLGAVYSLYLFSRWLQPETSSPLLSLVAAALLVANSAAAYWTVSGMETSLFMLLTILGCWFFLKERTSTKQLTYTPLIFVLLSMTRPEGMFLFGLSMGYLLLESLAGKTMGRRAGLTRLLTWCIWYAVPIAIFMVWRLAYYGYLFPNTYYSKAGISKEYFTAGMDYLVGFANMYLVWGLAMVVPLVGLWYSKWRSELLYLLYIVVAYSVYIVTVGGDVLPAYRFFIPMLPLIYLLMQEGFRAGYEIFRAKRSSMSYGVLLLAAAYVIVTYTKPYDYVREYWARENGLVDKMTETGRWIKAHSTPNTVIAASTIGAIGYYSDVTLVDMLGLTDETIAHHPETTFGVKSGWRERNYNVTYVLSRRPEWILFSTGIKPSAFAERALFTHQEFRRWYYPYYYHPTQDATSIDIMYKRAETPLPEVKEPATVNNDFINQFYEGMNRSRRWPKDAIPYFRKTIEIGPPDFPLVYQELGGIYYRQNDMQDALKYYQRAIDIDPRMVESRIMLGIAARENKDFETAKFHFAELTRYCPDYSEGWNFLGEAYLALGKQDSARAAFQHSIDVAPNNSDAYRYLQQLAAK